jgi:uncharacterized protein YgbK (DUF1537 family)
MPPAFGIIADDFTGAVMVAALLEGQGIACPVLFAAQGAGGLPGARVVIAAARSRTVPVAEALAEIAALHGALTKAGCTRIAYKACASFDSTPQGNIGPAADFLAARAGRRPVLLSAGFPRFGATVHQGYLFYRNRLVTDSIKRHDPLTPMEDADLVRFLGRQTAEKVGLINHLTLRRGDGALALKDLTEAGMGHVLCDASDDDDVAASVALALDSGLPVVASDPLIVGLAQALGMGAPPLPRPQAPAPGRVAVLAGSTGPVVLAQLAALSQSHPVLILDILAAEGVPTLLARALDWAAQQSGSFAISTAPEAEALAQSQRAFGALGAARRAEDILGQVAQGLRARGIDRFAVAGGETSGAVVAALDLTRARALPEGALGPGECLSDQGEPLWLFLKPGKLGGDHILAQAIAQGEGRSP